MPERSTETAYNGPETVYNIGKVIARNAALSGFPDRVAVIDTSKKGASRESSYSQLNTRANKLAHGLLKSGVKKGDRVFVLLPNKVETIETLLACFKIGAIYTPGNFRFSSEELVFLIGDTGAEVLIYDSEYSNKVGEILQQQSGLFAIELGTHELSVARDYYDFVEGMPERDPANITKSDELCMILFTAGTTGRPKGVKLTHRGTFFACLSNGISASLTRDDVYLGAPPMFHAGGLTCFQLYMLMINGTIVLQSRWTPKEALELIKEHGVTYHFGIATQLKMMVQVEGWADYVGSLRAVNGGGEPQPAELKMAFIDRGIAYVSGYGLTETGATGFNWLAESKDDPTLSKASECMGKPPAFVEVKIVDKTGVEVKPEESGEIIIRREPTGAIGYWNRPDDEAKKFRGDWIFTGDLGKVDEDGYFYVLGRTDDMIVSGGENIYPAEIERAIFSHPKVADVVIVKGKHPKWGQTPKAIIVPKPGKTITEGEITEYVAKLLASFKKPRKIVFVDSIPKSETGKIDKKKIKELYEEA
jgi:fatty-acyl-CoA synthase